MSLRDRIDNPDRRLAVTTPTVDQRAGTERRMPEWRRRALEQRDRLGYVAVSDLTQRGAA